MNWNNEEHKIKTIFYLFATVVLIIAIVGMLANFISYKDAIGLIKSKVPPEANILGSGGGVPETHYNFRWQGNLKGSIYLSADEDLNTRDYYDTYYKKDIAGILNGTIDKMGVEVPLKKINNFPVFYGKESITQNNKSHTLEVWVYLLDKGEKKYQKKFAGYEEVDYPITKAIVNTYRRQIDPGNTMTNKDVDWLCSFTHDSLHQYILGFFQRGEVPKLFTKPTIYAYRLDQIILGQNRYVRKYKAYWTKNRSAIVGVIYKFDGETYVRVIHNANYIACHNGGYTFNFWK